MPRQLAKISFVIALLAVGVVWASSKFSRESAERSPASLKTISITPSMEERSLLFHPQAKQRYTYNFKRKIDLNGLGSQVPSISYGGKFILDVLHADDKGFTAIVQSNVSQYSGKTPPLLRLKMDSAGKKIEISAEATTDEELQQYSAVTKDLISLWDFAADTDTLGKYDFRLEALPDSANFRIQKKTKLKYLAQAQTEITKSAHWLRWDNAMAMPAEVKGEESTRLGQGSATLDSLTGYHLSFESRSPIPSYSEAQLAKLNQKETLSLAQGKASDHAEYNKVNWEALVEQLKHLDRLSPNERLAAFGDLARLLRYEPGAIGKVLALLSAADIKAGADSTLFKTIVGALATSGGSEDQKALVGLYQNPDCPISGKGTILGAFTTTQAKPTSETTNFLREEMETSKSVDIRQGSSYALGAGLANGTGPSADQAMNSLRAQWNSAVQSGDLGSQLSLLDAIGNSGRSEFFPDLKNLVESQAVVDLRAKATFSLRFMNTTDSKSEIINQFNSANETMRESAVQAVALAPWAEQFRSPLQSCASHEAVDRIQKECGELLSAHSQVAGN
ncbi:MAG: hypothetical protein ACXWQO_07595 [Bdellovibrionota bacterium]